MQSFTLPSNCRSQHTRHSPAVKEAKEAKQRLTNLSYSSGLSLLAIIPSPLVSSSKILPQSCSPPHSPFIELNYSRIKTLESTDNFPLHTLLTMFLRWQGAGVTFDKFFAYLSSHNKILTQRSVYTNVPRTAF